MNAPAFSKGAQRYAWAPSSPVTACRPMSFTAHAHLRLPLTRPMACPYSNKKGFPAPKDGTSNGAKFFVRVVHQYSFNANCMIRGGKSLPKMPPKAGPSDG